MSHPLSVTKIGAYIAVVVVSTAVIVVLIHALFGSWAGGGIIGVLATGLSVEPEGIVQGSGCRCGPNAPKRGKTNGPDARKRMAKLVPVRAFI